MLDILLSRILLSQNRLPFKITDVKFDRVAGKMFLRVATGGMQTENCIKFQEAKSLVSKTPMITIDWHDLSYMRSFSKDDCSHRSLDEMLRRE